MLNNAKIWMLLSGIIILLSGFGFFSIIKSKEAERGNFIVKMGELASKVKQLEFAVSELDQIKKEKAEVELKYQSDIAALESQIAESKRSESQMKSKVETLTKEKDAMAKYSENSGLIVAKLQKKIEMLEREKRQAAEELRNAPEATAPKYVDHMADTPAPTSAPQSAEMGSKLAGEEIVDLGRIIIRQETNEAAKVEHVNTLYGFIVLSAGTDDGLHKDSIINITRNNRLVAKAVVKKVREATASAVTLPEWTREEIRVGDIISSAQLDAPHKEPFFKRA